MIYKIKYSSALHLLLLVIVILSEHSYGICQAPAENPQKLSMLFIGDIMGHDEQIWAAENRENNTYNYEEVFSYIKPVISEADLAIANFEVTLGGAPFSGYPAFSSPAELAVACKNAGIDCFVTANNHSADRGMKGIISTINRLDSLKIPHTGTFINKSARDSLYPLIINCKGKSIALLNYTYGTNGIKVPEPVIVNQLDKAQITADIMKAKGKSADLIILFLHWGTEYDTIPSKAQTDLAEYFFSTGVDMIIGSHPHVLQKMVWMKNTDGGKSHLAVYSMGNFVSNQRRPKTDGGAMVRVELTISGNSLSISDAGYYLTWVYTPIEKYRKKFYVLPCSEYENKPEFFSNRSDYYMMKRFLSGSRYLFTKQNVNMNEYIFNGNSWLLNN
jgi:poly-gamma-glutamate capsule biosynthesis protein CapA/YwtB (metallophosphatase superfamily)